MPTNPYGLPSSVIESYSPSPELQSFGALGVAKRPKRKAFSTNSLEAIQTIFGLSDPHMISVTEGDKFLAHFPTLTEEKLFPLSSPKTFVGIECEIENVMKIDPNIATMFWSVKEDGSLRNHGREFVTPGVIPVSLAEPALNLLFNGLNSNIDFSSRTSCHVHLDVRQLSLQQLVALTLAYTAVENLLFKFVGNNRRNNIFCVPLTETGLLEAFGQSPKKFMWAVDSYWSKYTAFNLLPITTQGSVEFRHMPGTNSIPMLLHWIELLCRLKTFVYRYEYDTIIQTIAGLNSNSRYRQFVESVFGEYIQYLDMANLPTDMEKPVYLVKNCSAVNAFHNRVLKSPNRDSHLGVRLSSWMDRLSADQVTALKHCHAAWGGGGSLETLFREMIRIPQVYKRNYPSFIASINTVISPAAKEVDTQEHSWATTMFNVSEP